MTTSNEFNLSGQHGAEAFLNLPEGVKIRLLNGAVGEVLANPHDGAYVLVKFLEHPQDPAKVDEEEFVFFNEVKEVV